MPINRNFAILALLFLSTCPVNASVERWDIDIILNNDKTSEWAVSLYHNESVNSSSYFVRTTLTDYSFSADDLVTPCRLQTSAGTLVVCENFEARNLTYRFMTSPVSIDILQNFNLFTHRLSIDQRTDLFRVRVRLQRGSVLADETDLRGGLKPFEPEFGEQSSDGRFIFITWNVVNPAIDQTLDVSVVYESLGLPNPDENIFFILVIAVLIIAFSVLAYRFTRRQPIQDVLPILTEAERKVMEILLREKGSVDQRVVVKETDFSKAKVSRVIQDLSQRGLVEKISKGRKNLIKLRKAVKAQKATNNDTKENRG
jgi:uncharacterized membrane protein